MSLDKQSLKELREMAAKLGVRNRSKMRKRELVEAISTLQQLHQDSIDGMSSSSLSSADLQDQQLVVKQTDTGLPIPPGYDQDRLVLMVQDPNHVFAYWEISHHTLDQIRTRFGRQSASLLLVHTGQSHEQRVIDLAANNYYLAIPPNQDCRVELAVRDETGETHILMSSNTVRTPAHRPSHRTDAEWMDVQESFATLLEMAELPDGGLSSADLVRRLETVKWDVPSLPSSDTLLSSAALSSGMLSSHTWLQH
jgi:uncharacterized protein